MDNVSMLRTRVLWLLVLGISLATAFAVFYLFPPK